MRKTYRTKKYTTRTKSISKTGIEKLRQTQLKHAKSFAQRKFLQSKQFDKQIRATIKENRIRVNTQRLTQISKLGRTQQQQETLLKLFGERTTRSGSKVVRVNTLTSKSQTERLAKITKKINAGKFNAIQHISKTKSFKERKKYLPSGTSLLDALDIVNSTEFYLEEKKLIIQHNRNVAKYGTSKAENMGTGIQLRNKYIKFSSKEDDDLIQQMVKDSILY